jgi:hypothetical protein
MKTAPTLASASPAAPGPCVPASRLKWALALTLYMWLAGTLGAS